jgi:exodeoxyribonuclease-1
MADTFFFYDLETSGINSRTARIMQFAGQRTDLDLKPIGEPVNVLIKLSPDTVPDPDAIMITGITPQATLQDGVTEAEFIKMFLEEVATPGTIFAGFNTVRFDDEFMRSLLYRNFCDAYTWEWKDNRSRWDLLDVVRMTRALRPEGINWPVGPHGEVTNRLELLTKANGLDHENAHDALNDVYATIAVAQLIKDKHPKLFDYLLKLRSKQEVKKVVQSGKTFVYTSGKYPKEFEHTTVAVMLAERPDGQGALAYDLRHDPTPFLNMTPDELAKAWQYTKDPEALRLPVKTLKYNRCPAVADLAVLQVDKAETLKRLQLNLATAQTYAKQLTPVFTDKLFAALQILDKARPAYEDAESVDGQLYNGFFDNADSTLMPQLVASDPEDISRFAESFHDKRLKQLVPLYKARNFPATLTSEERAVWDKHCYERLLAGGERSRLARYFARLGELADTTDEKKRFLLEELQLYGQSIMPVPEES